MSLTIVEERGDLEKVPFRYSGISHVEEQIPIGTSNPTGISTGGTSGNGGQSSWWEVLRFHLEEFDEDIAMPPKPVNRLNWQLVISVMSMSITLLTLLVMGAWSLSSKNTSLDTVTGNIAANTSEIRNQRESIQSLQIDIKGLKDQNQRLLDEVAEMKLQIQSKKDK
jgi:FtsZ-binding cell division protein ZapB